MAGLDASAAARETLARPSMPRTAPLPAFADIDDVTHHMPSPLEDARRRAGLANGDAFDRGARRHRGRARGGRLLRVARALGRCARDPERPARAGARPSTFDRAAARGRRSTRQLRSQQDHRTLAAQRAEPASQRARTEPASGRGPGVRHRGVARGARRSRASRPRIAGRVAEPSTASARKSTSIRSSRSSRKACARR